MSMTKNLSDFAVWVGGQLKAGRLYTDQQVSTATAALTTAITQAKADVAAQVKTELIGGASAAYDTFIELQQAVQADESLISGLSTAIGKRLRFDAAQQLSAAEAAQARSNIGAVSTSDVGSTDVDYVGLATAALNS